jgi:D-alanyl-D-alanine carboxypeptidase-like protein
MKRRNVLKTLGVGCLGVGMAPEMVVAATRGHFAGKIYSPDEGLKDYLHKIKNFNKPHKGDVQLEDSLYKTFESTVKRLRRLQKLVGHGNYNILNFTDGLSLARNYPDVGAFPKDELKFLEIVFYEDGQRYGFMGQKPITEITEQINKKDVIKVPYSGNYLYKDRSVELFEKIKKEVGDEVILTSGIRSVMKQFLLFLNKVYESEGNLSLASRSLAPPGYSFHGNGDFDVGQKGYGKLNFTGSFTETDVYKRLAELGYLQLRYPEDNRLGVRYEPWHIKINVNA